MLAYPTKQQTATQQSKDEYDCYNWSKTQSGYDPMAASVPSQSARNSKTRTRGRSTAREDRAPEQRVAALRSVRGDRARRGQRLRAGRP
jgi:hypothetical protein